MAIVGHFNSLAEAQKLTTSPMLKGVIQEIYEEGQLLPMLPATLISGKSLLYNRESTLPTADFYDIHEEIPWKADVTYATQVEVSLKRVARQDVIDEFMAKTYNNINDYKALILAELVKGCLRTIETKLIYGDAATYTKEFNGLDKLCAATGAHAFGANQDYDMGGSGKGLSLAILKDLVDQCKPRPTLILSTRTLINKLSLGLQLGVGTNNPITQITYGVDALGRRIPMFDGVPIVASDYMSTENDNTGGYLGSGNLVSVYAIRLGSLEGGGLSLVTGGDTGGGLNLFKVRELEALEDYDASGIRLTAYLALANGSTKAISRIHSVDQTASITA